MKINLFENIHIPEKVDEVVMSAFRKGRHTFFIRRGMTIIISLSILVMGMFGTACVSSSAAEALSKIPFVGSIFLQFTDNGLKSVSENGLTSLPYLEVTKQGSTVTLQEIYYDKSGISFGLAFKGMNIYESAPKFSLYYKGKLISGSVTGEINEESKDICLMTGKTDIPSNLPDSFELKLIVKESTGLKREFEFNLPISRAVVNTTTKEYSIMKTYSYNGRNVLIKKVVCTPASLSIDFEYTRPLDDAEISIKLYDEYDNEIQLNDFTGTNQEDKTKRIDTYHADFNPTSDIPSELRLDIRDISGVNTQFSVRFEIK